jgi:hypothetical protein
VLQRLSEDLSRWADRLHDDEAQNKWASAEFSTAANGGGLKVGVGRRRGDPSVIAKNSRPTKCLDKSFVWCRIKSRVRFARPAQSAPSERQPQNNLFDAAGFGFQAFCPDCDSRQLRSASREGCRMSKRRMLMLFERNGRGRSGLAAALPGQHHSRSGSLLSWTNQQPPCTGTQVRGSEETDWWTSTRSVRPSSRAVDPARRSTEGVAGRQAGTQTCRCVAPRS